MTLKGNCHNPEWTGKHGIIEQVVDAVEQSAFPIEREKAYLLTQQILRYIARYYSNEQMSTIFNVIRRSDSLKKTWDFSCHLDDK